MQTVPATLSPFRTSPKGSSDLGALHKMENGTGRNGRRKICFVITSFIHYSRNLLILEELKNRPDVDLSIVVGGTALLGKYSSKYGSVKDLLKKDGHTKLYEIYFSLEGDTTAVKAKTAGLGIVEYSTLFNNLKPDLVMVRGDRFEVLAAALAAAFMNIPVAHIEGGDVSGTLDESIRHAITKLSHLHFATNEDARKRLFRMGENPKFVYNFGSPDVEVVEKVGNCKVPVNINDTGSGAVIDLKKPYLMVMYHPVWESAKNPKVIAEKTRELLQIILEHGIQTFWFWPNSDVGNEEISAEIRRFQSATEDHKIRFMRFLPPRIFLPLLKNAACLVGNSSAGLKECSYLGIPVVNVGNRQDKRLRTPNIIDVAHDREKIKKAIKKQYLVGRYPSSTLYRQKDTAKNIAKVAASEPLYLQKVFHD